MRAIFLSVLGILGLFFVYYTLVHNFPESQARKILYYYPNGFIFHTNPQNHHLIGYNIFEDKNLPPINVSEDILVEQNKKFLTQVTYDFSEYLLIAHFLFGFGIWFYIRSGDVLFLLLFLGSSLFAIFNFFVLVYNAYYFFFFFIFSFIIFILLHLVMRVKGIDIPTKWYVSEIALSLVIGFFGRNSGENSIVFQQLFDILVYSLLLVAFSAVFVIFYDFIKYRLIHQIEKDNTPTNFSKKVILGLSVFSIVIIPYLILKFNVFKGSYLFTIIFCAFFLGISFIFLYSNYGIAYLPQQIIFTSALSLIFQTTFYVGIYATLFLLYKYFNVQEEGVFFINILFLCLVIIIAVSLKNTLSEYIEELSFAKERELNQTLQEMTEIIREPSSFKHAVKEILSKASQALEVKKINVLTPAERFENPERLTDLGIVALPLRSPIWKYFSKEKDITVTSYMSYGSGVREEVYRYLSNLEVQIAYPVFNSNSNGTPNSVLLVGEKKDKTNFSIAELKFIKECTRLGDLLMQNYSLVISDIQKKKMEKDLESAQLQLLIPKNVGTDSFYFGNLEISSASMAAVGVSGDYLDFFKDESKGKITIFLGDVSGHGIGSAYMVSAVKGLVSELMKQNFSLESIFRYVNDLLINKFPGNFFMSLIGGTYNVEDSSFEFINAGHLHPLIIHKDKTKNYIQTPDRVLGILRTPFTIKKIFLEEWDRLILFTDGVTETFNPQEEIFGIKRLEDCILENLKHPTEELIQRILETLKNFRDGSDLSDDLTLLCLTKLTETKE